MAQSATVGILRALLTLNTAEFEAGMQKASAAAKTWSKDLNQIGQQAQQVGSALTKTITIPIVAAFAGAAKAAMDFESDFANVAKTVDGVSDSSGKLTKEGKELAGVFRNMAKEIPKTTSELTSIAALGGQMGVPIKQLEHFTKNVAALGVAVDGISTEEAAAGLAQIGNITGQGTANIDKMASALVHLGNSSNATEADILEFTKRLSGAGHAVGMTVPEIMAIGTAMANVGLNAEAGGTAMSTMIAKMSMAVSEGGESLKAFDRLVADTGQRFADIWKRSPVEAVDAVVQGLARAKASGEDLNITVREIGATNIRSADTMKRLAGAGDGVAQSLKIANEGWQTGNKHLEEAEKRYATTHNQLKMLWSQIRDVGITLGNALLPGIKSATEAVSGLIPAVDMLAKGFALLPGPIQMGAVGMGLALAATGPLIYAFGTLARASGDLVGAFQKKGIATLALTKAMQTFGGTASTAVSWVTRVGVAARASGLLFAGFTAAVAGIAVPIALIVISERIEKLKKDLQDIDTASRLAKRPVQDPDEARRLLAAQQAGEKGGILPGAAQMTKDGIKPAVTPFQPPTVEELRIWSEAKGAAQAYAGQVVQVQVEQKKVNAEFASGRALNLEQIQSLAQLSGATTQYAGGVVRIGQAHKSAAGSTEMLAQAQKELTAANAAYLKDIAGKQGVLKFSLENMDALNLTVEKIADKYKVSKEHVARFQSELKAGVKATQEAEKASEAHARALEKQRDALQKLGIVTDETVNDALREFESLLTAAGIKGAPQMDRALAALHPKLKELKDQADASGIQVRGLTLALESSARALERVGQHTSAFVGKLPAVRSGLDGLSLPVVDLAKAMNVGAIQAGNTAESFKFFGVSTQASLHATARAAVAHFTTIKNSGEASPAAIQEAFDKMQAAILAAGGKIRTGWKTAMGDLANIADSVGSAFENAFGRIVQGAAQALRGLQRLMDATTLLGKISAGIDLGIQIGKFVAGLFRDEEHEEVNDIRDQFLSQFGPGGTGPTSGFGILGRQLNALGRGDLFRDVLNAKKVEDFERAMRAAEAALEGARAEMARITEQGGMASRQLLAFRDATRDSAETLAFIRSEATTAATSIGEFVKVANFSTQAGATAATDLIAASFAELRAQGLSIQEVFAILGPTIADVGKDLAEAGLEGSAAFNDIARLAEIAAGEITGPILTGVNALSRGMEAAHNAGLLTQDMFAGLTIEILNGRQALIDQGVAAEDANRLMQRDLQRIWQLRKDYNFVVDESTEKLLAEAEASGLVGDQFRSAMDRAAIAMENAAKAIIRHFGGIADEAENTGTRIDKAFRPRTVQIGYEVDDAPELPAGSFRPDTATTGGTIGAFGMIRPRPMTTGGSIPVDWTPQGMDSVPILGKPGEVILTEGMQANIARALASAKAFTTSGAFSAQSGRWSQPTPPQAPNVYVTVEGDVKDIEHARELAREVGKQIRRGGQLADYWRTEVMPTLNGA